MAVTPSAPRLRDADKSQLVILSAAMDEFSQYGYAGARVDRIAERAEINKRLIYYYFGNKDELFLAVLERTYADIRAAEQALHLDAMDPVEAIRQLVSFTWHYYLEHPEFITLVNSENLHEARHLAGNERVRELQQAYVKMVQGILERGAATGAFRKGIDAANLCITIAAVGFYYLSNQHTGRAIFGHDFTRKSALAARLQFNLDTVMRLVLRHPEQAS